MAKYRILRVNKMTSGTHRGLIDMDIQLVSYAQIHAHLLKGVGLSSIPELEDARYEAGIMTETGKLKYDATEYIEDHYGSQTCALAYESQDPVDEDHPHQPFSTSIVLNEDQTKISQESLDDDAIDNPPDAIRVLTESDLSDEALASEVDQYSSEMRKVHVVYEFEKMASDNAPALLSGDSTMLLPLNDILDLCIKSRFKKASCASLNVPSNLDGSTSQNVDQWLVLDRYPADFCQCGNDAFVITQLMDSQPWRLKTDIESHIASTDDFYKWGLVSDPIQTVLYPSPSELGFSSYQEFLENAKDHSEAMAQLFVQQRKIHGVQYNYIVALDQTCRYSGNSTVYSNGDIFGYFTTAKNMYNSLYTIDMPDASQIKSCRQYCGVQRSCGKVLLKYYDSIDYDVHSDIARKSSQSTMVPFQKVEFFQPDKMSSVTKHKSNLFSVVMRSTGLDDGSVSQSSSSSAERHIADSMRKDIVNGIKAIVDNVAPANTQLFDAQFT